MHIKCTHSHLACYRRFKMMLQVTTYETLYTNHMPHGNVVHISHDIKDGIKIIIGQKYFKLLDNDNEPNILDSENKQKLRSG